MSLAWLRALTSHTLQYPDCNHSTKAVHLITAPRLYIFYPSNSVISCVIQFFALSNTLLWAKNGGHLFWVGWVGKHKNMLSPWLEGSDWSPSAFILQTTLLLLVTEAIFRTFCVQWHQHLGAGCTLCALDQAPKSALQKSGIARETGVFTYFL